MRGHRLKHTFAQSVLSPCKIVTRQMEREIRRWFELVTGRFSSCRMSAVDSMDSKAMRDVFDA